MTAAAHMLDASSLARATASLIHPAHAFPERRAFIATIREGRTWYRVWQESSVSR